MRPIKFRAWDGKKYYQPEEMIQCGDEGVTTGYFDLSGYPKTSDHILEQYTGFKDKNGVEIYEGDLLTSETVYLKEDEDLQQPCEVFWNTGLACFSIRQSHFHSTMSTYLYGWKSSVFEVIGNIHVGVK